MSQCYSIIIDRGISTHGHVKEVVDILNACDKRCIYQLMSTVQLPGSNIFYSQMQIHTGNQKDDVILAKEFQHHLTKEHRKNGVFDQVKNNKQFMEIKWIDRQYHVKDNYDIAHQDVRMYCNTNQLISLPFCGTHSKPHGARGLSKHYHLCFDPKLSNGVSKNWPYNIFLCCMYIHTRPTLDIWYTIR